MQAAHTPIEPGVPDTRAPQPVVHVAPMLSWDATVRAADTLSSALTRLDPHPNDPANDDGDDMEFVDLFLDEAPVSVGYVLIAGCVMVQGIDTGRGWADANHFLPSTTAKWRREIERQLAEKRREALADRADLDDYYDRNAR